MNNLKLLGLFGVMSLSVTSSFGRMIITEHKLGTMTLDSGAYQWGDGEKLGPLQHKEINTSNGRFRLTPDKVENLTNNSEVSPITDQSEIDNLFRKLYSAASKDYIRVKNNLGSNTFEVSKGDTLKLLDKTGQLRAIHQDLGFIAGMHGAITKYDPLRIMLEQKDKVKMYRLGNENLLIAGPTESLSKYFSKSVESLVYGFHDMKNAEYQANKPDASEEDKAKFEELKDKYQEMLKNANLSDNYDQAAVKKYVENPMTVIEFHSHMWALQALSNPRKQLFVLVNISEPSMDEAFQEATVSNGPLASHTDMLFGTSESSNNTMKKVEASGKEEKEEKKDKS